MFWLLGLGRVAPVVVVVVVVVKCSIKVGFGFGFVIDAGFNWLWPLHSIVGL